MLCIYMCNYAYLLLFLNTGNILPVSAESLTVHKPSVNEGTFPTVEQSDKEKDEVIASLQRTVKEMQVSMPPPFVHVC